MTATLLGIHLTGTSGAPLHAVDEAVLEAGRGIVGDRYHQGTGTFSEKLADSDDSELTLIEREEIAAFNAAEGVAHGDGAFRRNLVTQGVRLNDLVGRRFRIGGAEVEGLRLCEPCTHLASFLGPRVIGLMVHKAGLRARIVSGGTIRVGDAVTAGSAGMPR